MNFKQYWIELMKQKPIKDGQKITLTKEQFKKVQLQAFQKGFFGGASLKKEKPPNNGIFDIFNEFFK